MYFLQAQLRMTNCALKETKLADLKHFAHNKSYRPKPQVYTIIAIKLMT